MVTSIMAPPPALAPRFSIGRTLSLSCVVLWRNPWRLSAIALAVTGLQVAVEFYAPAAGAGLPSAVAALLTFAIVTTPVTVAALLHLRGGQPSFAPLLRGGLRRIIRVSIGTVIVFFVVLLPPAMLLMLGGAIQLPDAMLPVLIGIGAVYVLAISSIWFTAVPVLVIEDTGILASFGRSRDLTRGHRWAVLALVLVLAAVLMVLAMIATTVRLSLIVRVPVEMVMHPWLSLTMVPLAAFSSLVTAIVPAVAYHLLQVEREGGGVDMLARVFD